MFERGIVDVGGTTGEEGCTTVQHDRSDYETGTCAMLSQEQGEKASGGCYNVPCIECEVGLYASERKASDVFCYTALRLTQR